MKFASDDLPRCHTYQNPTQFLAELIRCKACNGQLVKINGRIGGHYGCCNAKRKSCPNVHLLQDGSLASIILSDLKEKLLKSESTPNIDKPIECASYYVSHTNIHTLSLLRELQG